MCKKELVQIAERAYYHLIELLTCNMCMTRRNLYLLLITWHSLELKI